MGRRRPLATPPLFLLLLLLLALAPAGSSRSAGRGPAGLDAPAARRVLNVTRESTRDEIRAAFRRASLTTHPDKDGGSTERFILVGEAYEVLRHVNHHDGGEYDDDDGDDGHGHDDAGHDAGTSRWDAAGHRHHRRRRHPRGDDDDDDVGRSFRRRSFDEFARSRGAWDAAGVGVGGVGGGDGWGGDLWDSPTGRRRAAAAAFGDASAGGDAPGSSRKWYERGRGDASSRGGRAAGAGGVRRGGRGVEPGDSFGFGVGDGSSSDDDWVRRDWNEADPGRRSNHPGHSRTNPRAGGLHDDTDGAIPQGPGAEGGGGGKWWERRGGNGDGDGGVFHPLFRDGFSRSRGGFSGGSDADRRGAFHGGYAPPEGADTSPPGEGEFGDGSSSDVGPDDPPMRRRASQSEPPKFDDEETMEEYVARRAYADSFGMTGHDRTLGDGGDEKSAPGDGGDGEDAGGVPSPSAPSNEGMAQAEWEWRLEDLEAALGGDAWGATGPGGNPGNDYLCAEGVEEFCVA